MEREQPTQVVGIAQPQVVSLGPLARLFDLLQVGVQPCQVFLAQDGRVADDACARFGVPKLGEAIEGEVEFLPVENLNQRHVLLLRPQPLERAGPLPPCP